MGRDLEIGPRDQCATKISARTDGSHLPSCRCHRLGGHVDVFLAVWPVRPGAKLLMPAAPQPPSIPLPYLTASSVAAPTAQLALNGRRPPAAPATTFLPATQPSTPTPSMSSWCRCRVEEITPHGLSVLAGVGFLLLAALLCKVYMTKLGRCSRAERTPLRR